MACYDIVRSCGRTAQAQQTQQTPTNLESFSRQLIITRDGNLLTTDYKTVVPGRGSQLSTELPRLSALCSTSIARRLPDTQQSEYAMLRALIGSAELNKLARAPARFAFESAVTAVAAVPAAAAHGVLRYTSQLWQNSANTADTAKTYEPRISIISGEPIYAYAERGRELALLEPQSARG